MVERWATVFTKNSILPKFLMPCVLTSTAGYSKVLFSMENAQIMLEMVAKCSNYAKNSGLCFLFWIILFEADYAKNYVSILYQCLATVQVLTFGGYDTAGWKIQQGRSLFNLVISVENTLLCMFQRLCTYFQDTGVLIFGGLLLLLLLLFIGKPQQAFKASLQGARDISW